MTIDREVFLAAMRGVANSVAIVTTDGVGGRHGATVTSFCSVSADPPSVLVCLRGDSRIARTVTENRCFAINVLAAHADGLADRFAGRGDDRGGDRFEGVAIAADPAGAPILADATVALRCRLTDAIERGTHLVVIGEVWDARTLGTMPLTYLDGGYAALEAVLPPDRS